jgi:hypothetical protein
MPTIAAMALAGILSFLIKDWLRPLLGLRLAALVSLIVWGVVYYYTRRWLLELRGE